MIFIQLKTKWGSGSAAFCRKQQKALAGMTGGEMGVKR